MSADVAAFFRAVYALEREAGERYAELADQMEVHNNKEVAALFRKLADVEGRHATQILERARRLNIDLDGADAPNWLATDGPETTPFGDVHYLMTPHHALFLALRNEERAEKHFQRMAETAPNSEVRALAAEIAAEEREHVAMVRAMIAKHPPPEALWSDDPDPPVYSE